MPIFTINEHSILPILWSESKLVGHFDHHLACVCPFFAREWILTTVHNYRVKVLETQRMLFFFNLLFSV